MTIAELTLFDLRRQLVEPGLFFRTGPFIIHLRSDLPDLPPLLQRLYADYPAIEDRSFADFHIRLYCPGIIRRWWRPQVQFQVDAEKPFAPFPRDTALPFLEWGLNWCIAHRAHQYLLLHAAVVEKQGRALLLPAWPGAGKSTLCAALVHRGWRLLSDEFGMVRLADWAIVSMPRLIALKNQSIAVMRAFAPDAVLGPEFPKTRKGVVAHLRPPRASILRAEETARAAWIVFPEFAAGAGLWFTPVAKENAFVKLSHNCFNYELTGLRGFEAVAGLIDCCSCYALRYGELEQAVARLDELLAEGGL